MSETSSVHKLSLQSLVLSTVFRIQARTLSLSIIRGESINSVAIYGPLSVPYEPLYIFKNFPWANDIKTFDYQKMSFRMLSDLIYAWPFPSKQWKLNLRCCLASTVFNKFVFQFYFCLRSIGSLCKKCINYEEMKQVRLKVIKVV